LAVNSYASPPRLSGNLQKGALCAIGKFQAGFRTRRTPAETRGNRVKSAWCRRFAKNISPLAPRLLN